MHKILITDPAGVVINTKHHACGELLNGVPRGIAKALVHFKQGKDVGAGSELRSLEDAGGGSPAEDFTAKLKFLLIEEYKLTPAEAEDLIKSDHGTVSAGIPGGNATLRITAVALLRGGFTGKVLPLDHPASRLIQTGAAPTGGATILPNQPTAPLTGGVDVGGTIAAAIPGAMPPSPDQPTDLQKATAHAEDDEINAAAEKKVSKAHKGK
jgi:hypothetical protein